MLRSLSLLLVLPFVFAASVTSAQPKKAAPTKPPGAKDPSISVTVFLRDAGKDEVLLGYRTDVFVWDRVG